MHGCLVVAGLLAPLVSGTWRQLAVAAPSAGGAAGRLASPIGIGYGTEQAAIAAASREQSGMMKLSQIPDSHCLEQTSV